MTDSDAELNLIKQDIRSLLISAPNGLTPHLLEKDYKEVVGQPLPYQKYGFFSCLQFVRSLHDTVYVSSRGSEIFLFGVSNKNTEHISRMVRKQKKPKSYARLSRQQRKPAPKVKSHNSQTASASSTKTSNSTLDSSRNSTARFYSAPRYMKQKIMSPNQSTFTQITTSTLSDDNTSIADSAFETAKSHSLTELQGEVVELLKDCINGIRSIDVPDRYEAKYHKEFDLHKYGYYSIVEFLVSISNRVHMCRINRSGDWLLKLRDHMGSNDYSGSNLQKPTADISKIEKDIKELAKKYKGGIVVKSLEDIYEMHFGRCLPVKELGLSSVAELLCMIIDKVDLIDNELCLHASSSLLSSKSSDSTIQSAPVDAVGRNVYYNRCPTPLKEWGFFDCYVAHVTSPEDFMIQVISEDTTGAFDPLMDELEKAYTHPNAKEYKMPLHMAKVGQICVALYHGDNNWNRAIIDSEPQAGFVDVKYVDYGDIASVSIDSLYLMKAKFLTLPALMVCCRLAHLKPPDFKTWSSEAKRTILGICRNKPMVAQVVGSSDQNVISILLCDTSQDNVDVYLNDVLLDKGLAMLVYDDSTPEELERLRKGIEMENYQNSDITNSDLPLESPPPYEEQDALWEVGKRKEAKPYPEKTKRKVPSGSTGSPVLPSVKASSDPLEAVGPPPGLKKLSSLQTGDEPHSLEAEMEGEQPCSKADDPGPKDQYDMRRNSPDQFAQVLERLVKQKEELVDELVNPTKQTPNVMEQLRNVIRQLNTLCRMNDKVSLPNSNSIPENTDTKHLPTKLPEATTENDFTPLKNIFSGDTISMAQPSATLLDADSPVFVPSMTSYRAVATITPYSPPIQTPMLSSIATLASSSSTAGVPRAPPGLRPPNTSLPPPWYCAAKGVFLTHPCQCIAGNCKFLPALPPSLNNVWNPSLAPPGIPLIRPPPGLLLPILPQGHFTRR